MSTIEWHGETFELRPDGSAFRPASRTLLIADPHFGKAATFRQAGIPVPETTTDATLDRLSRSLDATDAAALVVLGDFFHARSGLVSTLLDTLAAWREQAAALTVTLVRGNHDAHAGDPPASWDIRCVDEPWIDDDIACRHHPAANDAGPPSIAGHLHPGVVLRDADGTRLRLPCFCFGPHRALLPAYGSFTGRSLVAPSPDDRVFVPAEDEVMEIPTPVRRRGTRRLARPT